MSMIRTDDSMMERDQEQFQETIQEFFRAQKAMVNQMEELSLMWKGSSKDAFMKQFQNDCLCLNDLKKELGVIAEEIDMYDDSPEDVMACAKAEYRNCDGNVRSLIDSLKF